MLRRIFRFGVSGVRSGESVSVLAAGLVVSQGREEGVVGGVSDGELDANAEVMSQSRTMACRTRAEDGAGGAVAEIRFPPRG